MRLLLEASVDLGEHITSHERWWRGFRYVERPYSRVPMVGESVRLGDDPDSLPWPVDHVSWHNSGVPALTLTFEDADPTFDDIRAVGALSGSALSGWSAGGRPRDPAAIRAPDTPGRGVADRPAVEFDELVRLASGLQQVVDGLFVGCDIRLGRNG